LRRHSEGLLPILPPGPVLFHEAEERFMHERRRLQYVARAFTPHLVAGDAA